MSDVASDDAASHEGHPTLILGVMGVGTFVVGLLFLLVCAIWFLSYSCIPQIKHIWRGIFSLLLVVVSVILWFAPHSHRFDDGSFESAVRSFYI